MIHKVLVANLNISAITKSQFLSEVKSLLESKQQTFITTPNSEFLYASLTESSLRDLFNSADIALADGIAIMWAERYLDIPLRSTGFWGKIIETWVHVVVSGARILLTPSYLYKNIPEKITGADVFFDLIKLASENNKTVYFVNHRSDSAEKTAELLKEKYPRLQIVGLSRKNWNDLSLLEDIQRAKPDLLFLAYGQPKQEQWIANHLKNLPVTVAMGVGGTFDYASGFKTPPPVWIRSIGLEWFFRLVTQPSRLPRIYRATWGLILSLVRYKVFSSYGYRNNVSIIVINNQNQILLCENNPNKISKVGYAQRYNPQGEWLPPQGGVKPGEDLQASALRELKEEVNISSVQYLGTAKHINTFDWPNGIRGLFSTKRLFRGQKQQTAFFRFTGQDSEIILDPKVFSRWQWVDLDKAQSVVSGPRQDHLKKVVAELTEALEKNA